MLSLRQRLTRQAAWAILSLVLGFGAVTWTATAFHLYAVTRSQAASLAQSLSREPLSRAIGTLSQYRAPGSPQIWIMNRSGIHRSTPTPAAPPPVGLFSISGPHPMVVVAASSPGMRVVVGWPLSADLDVLRDLLGVLLLLGLVSGVIGLWLARWATLRMLTPVDRMTTAVSQMVEKGTASSLPTWSDSDDEFNRLTHVFNQLLTQLRQQTERERRVLAEAAHEFRTPLQVLDGNLDLLSGWGGLDPQIREESLGQSRAVTARLTRLVSDLLTLERASAPRQGEMEPVDLSGLTDSVVEDLKAQAGPLAIAYQRTPTWVLASPWAVERALWAVLDNALKYTPAGGAVQLGFVEEGLLAGVRIEDNGPGIPPEDLPFVATRFYRSARHQSLPGSGLGLPIAKALVEQEGGRFHLESTVGQGTAVTLLWPRFVT